MDNQLPLPEGVYPLNGGLMATPTGTGTVTPTGTSNKKLLYPDFRVWEHSNKDDTLMRKHLQKGYYEPPIVANECHSGRQIVYQLFHKNSQANNHPNNGTPGGNSNMAAQENIENTVKSKLTLLSDVMIKTIIKRRDINKITSKSSYKPPPRVTLTDHKRELWLNNLADSNVSLKQLSRAIPHGLRNRTLLEQCMNHKVPIQRTLWLIRCVSANEQRQLKRKMGNSMNSNKWVIEWTEQLTLFVENVIESCFKIVNKPKWKYQLTYIIELLGNIYSEELMYRETFLNWLVSYLRKIVNKESLNVFNFKTLSIYYLFLKLFWFKVINVDYLAKELSECMLILIAKLQELPKSIKVNNLEDSKGSDYLINQLSSKFQTLTKYLFYYNSDSFIIPTRWFHLKSYLRKLIDTSQPLVGEQFKLITYRNESLTIDDSYTGDQNFNKSALIVNKLDNFNSTKEPDHYQEEELGEIHKLIFGESLPETNHEDPNSNWKTTLKVVLEWTITSNRDSSLSFQRICLISTILQMRIQQITLFKPKKSRFMRQELEMEITELIYEMSDIITYNYKGINKESDLRCLNNLLLLIAKLYSLGLLVISTYLRRLIASGVIYLMNADKSCYIHLIILNSLPMLNDSNSKNILKRLSNSTGIQLIDKHEIENMDEKITLFMNNALNDIEEQHPSSELYESTNYIWNAINDVDPLGFGRKFQLLEKLMEKFKNELLNRNLKSLACRSLIKLSNIFNNKSTMFPEFIKALIEYLNSSNDHLSIDLNTSTLILKLIRLNLDLLASCGYGEKNNHLNIISTILKSWITKNKYNMAKAFKNVPIPSLKIDLKEIIQFQTPTIEDYPNLRVQSLNMLGISSFERLLNAAEFSTHINQSITQYINIVKGFNNSQLDQTIKTVLTVLRDWKHRDFDNIVSLYIKKFVLPTLSLDYEMSLKLILKLLIDNFINLETVVNLFMNSSITKDEFSTWSNDRIVCDLLFGSGLDRLNDLELFSLLFERSIYKEVFSKDYFMIVSLITKKTHASNNKESSNNHDVTDIVGVVDDVVPVDMMNSLHDLTNVSTGVVDNEEEQTNDVVRDNGVNVVGGGGGGINNNNRPKIEGDWKSSPELVDSIWSLVGTDLELFNELYYNVDSRYITEIKNFFFWLLEIPVSVDNSNGGNDPYMIGPIIAKLTYFNLPICQWLFKTLIEENSNLVDDEYDSRNNKITDVIVQLLNHLSETCQQPNDNESKSYLIGELFDQLSNNHKLKFLYTCESLYLGSEKFPRLITNGKNLTRFLINMVSSCSRLKDYNSSVLPLSDTLVFSLNMSLEKLMYFCSNLEHKKNKKESMKDLEISIILLSRIILIHKSFLVELILQRSVNLQRDVLLLNLTKLFKNRVMEKNLKLKNLVYDVLISIKLQISDALVKQQQPQQQQQQQQQQPQQPVHTIQHTPQVITSLSLSRSTPGGSQSFISPTNSPMQPNLERSNSIVPNTPGLGISPIPTGTTTAIRVTNNGIMNISPPNFNNKLHFLLDQFKFSDQLPEPNKNYYLVYGSTIGGGVSDPSMIRFTLKKFEMIEDSSPRVGLNDSFISLSYFDSSVEKSNPK